MTAPAPIPPATIRVLSPAEAAAAVPALSAVLMDCVAGGASVSFMAPLTRARADAFWTGVARGVAAGERILLVAEEGGPGGTVVGTVQVVISMPENQPHRGDIAKMLVHRRARRRGIAEALMRGAEAAARDAGRTLLVLDTASDTAERLYERLGWTRLGTIPGFALLPDGRPWHTVFFYKDIAAA